MLQERPQQFTPSLTHLTSKVAASSRLYKTWCLLCTNFQCSMATNDLAQKKDITKLK